MIPIDVDTFVRICAGVAAVALVAWPSVVAGYTAAAGWLRKDPAKPEAGIDDMRTVLELANRLRLVGNAEGVKLCQQLLDVMLRGVKS